MDINNVSEIYYMLHVFYLTLGVLISSLNVTFNNLQILILQIIKQ
jgi:hypothetical protein